MDAIRTAFLSRFDSPTQTYIYEFGKRLTSIQADVLMLVARKATCFIDSLCALDLATLGGVTTSDRVLDASLDWLKGKSVAVIDDAVISGTTLYRTLDKLQGAGVGNLSAYAFCINKEWWCSQLVQPVRPYLELDDDTTTAVCSSIVDALSVIPRPYAVDYPILTGLRIPAEEIETACTIPGWVATDVSSPLQREHGVVTITITPDDEQTRRFRESIGWPASLTGISKVRLFARQQEHERETFWCSVVPIVACNPITHATINSLWDSLLLSVRETGAAPAVGRLLTSVTSRLRLIQYLAAYRVGSLWVEDLRNALAAHVHISHDRNTIRYLFPPPLIQDIQAICELSSPLFCHASDPCEPRPALTAARPTDAPNRGNHPTLARAVLTQPFLELFNSKELRARELAKAHGPAVFTIPEFAEIVDRLNQGYSLAQLCGIARIQSTSTDCETDVSLFLDQAIDRGIVVPVTAERNATVLRAYRHGEDVRFGNVEVRLCALMLAQAAEAANRATLPAIWVEKLMVLLIRIGLQKGILNPWLGQPGIPTTMGVRYSLHGAVVGGGTDRPYKFFQESGLTSLLVQDGVLERTAGESTFRVKRIPSTAVTRSAETEAKRIGYLFGRMLGDLSGAIVPHLEVQNLTLLASCLGPSETANAIAAEMDIINRTWSARWAAQRQLPRDAEGAAELADALRRSDTFEAANNGTWKFQSYSRRTAWDVIRTKGENFKDPLYKETWYSYWPEIGAVTEAGTSDELRALLVAEGRWCMRVDILLRMLELGWRYSAWRDTRDTVLQKRLSAAIRKQLGELSERAAELATYGSTRDGIQLADAATHLERRINKGTLESGRLVGYVFARIESELAESRSLIDRVDLVAAPFGRPRTIRRMSHVVCVQINEATGGSRREWDAVRNAITEIKARARKVPKGQRCTIEVLPRGLAPGIHGKWIAVGGSMARAWCLRLANSIASAAHRREALRVTVIAHLPEDSQILGDQNSGSSTTGFLVARVADIMSSSKLAARKSHLVVVAARAPDRLPTILDELEREVGGIAEFDEQLEINSAVPEQLEFDVVTWKWKQPASIMIAASPIEKSSRWDVGVVTVVTEEAIAMNKALERAGSVARKMGSRNERLYYEGCAQSLNNGQNRVVCVQALEQGSRSFELAYSDLCQEYDPRLIVLVGIGGAIHKSVQIGDVVVGEQIVYYDKRKVTPDGTVRRGDSYKMDAWLRVWVNDWFVQRGSEPAVLPSSEKRNGNQFRILRGPIGSGEAVLAYRDAEEREWLMQFNDKTLALETEAGGLAQAFYEARLQVGHRPAGYLVLRGISDHADVMKDDSFRQIAADNAAETLLALLESMPRVDALLAG